MKTRLTCLFILAVISPPVDGQWIQRGALKKVTQQNRSEVLLECTRGSVLLSFLSPSMIRVRCQESPVFAPVPSFAVLPAVRKPPLLARQGDLSFESTCSATGIPGISVTINPRTGAISYSGGAAHPFLEEDPRTSAVRADGRASRVWMKLPGDEHYFGFGEKSGPLSKRGCAVTHWNTDAYYYGSGTDPLYQSIPFFLAIRGGRSYGLFLDAPERSSFDMGSQERDTFSFGAASSTLDYYVIHGPGPKEVICRFTELTGRMPLPPHWAIGYQQCRYSYFPESRVREIAREFRKRRIPCDALYLDIDYMDGFRCFTWDREKFPDPKKMIRDLNDMDFSIVVMIDPGIKAEKGYFVYDQGVEGDHFVKNPDGTLYKGRVWPGDCVFPDFHREATRRWWGTLYKGLLETGVRGVWNDMNEPSVFNGPGGTMPLDVVHRAWGKEMPHAYCHNTYGMQMVRATREGILALRPGERVFVLTRASYAGGQRFAAGWTGDNRSYYEHLEQSVPMVLNWGVSGQPFCGPDVGGFTGSPTPELLTRWIQMGSLLPLFRNHTSKNTRDQEPWVHGKPYEDINRRFIELRYEMLPFLYSLFREAAETGVPVARLPLLEFPGWEPALKPYHANQFMVGSDLLVSPVVRIGETTWPVCLPEGKWFDFWTGLKRDSDGKRFKVDAPLETMPVFVRAGAVIPMQAVVQHTGEKPEGALILRVYPGKEKRVFPFYEDDGISYAYRKGEYRITGLSATLEKKASVFRVEYVRGKLGPRRGACVVKVFDIDRKPGRVTLNSRELEGWKYDTHQKCVEVAVTSLESGMTIRVQIGE